jgi:hypothetical protein
MAATCGPKSKCYCRSNAPLHDLLYTDYRPMCNNCRGATEIVMILRHLVSQGRQYNVLARAVNVVPPKPMEWVACPLQTILSAMNDTLVVFARTVTHKGPWVQDRTGPLWQLTERLHGSWQRARHAHNSATCVYCTMKQA